MSASGSCEGLGGWGCGGVEGSQEEQVSGIVAAVAIDVDELKADRRIVEAAALSGFAELRANLHRVPQRQSVEVLVFGVRVPQRAKVQQVTALANRAARCRGPSPPLRTTF